MSVPSNANLPTSAANPSDAIANELEASFLERLDYRSRAIAGDFQPLTGFTIARRAVPYSPDRFDAQVSPYKHVLNVTSTPCDAVIEIDSRSKSALYQAGNFIFVPRGASTNGHTYQNSEFISVLIEDACFQQVSSECDGPGRIDLLPILQGRDDLLRHLAHTLVAELSKGSQGDALYIDILSRALIAHTVRNVGAAWSSPGKDYRLSSRMIGAVIDYVGENLGQDIRLEALATSIGVSASKLHKQFRAAMGIPLHKYVIQQRVKRAREMLSASTLSLAEIASSTGFADQSHLTRIMRQYTGLTPKTFRSA